MSSSTAITVPVLWVISRQFIAPAPNKDRFQRSPIMPVSDEPVRGWLVGVSDGRTWGWWGPVSRLVARHAVAVHTAVIDTTPASPNQWAERARRGTRHAHSGLGALAVGAFELATWDLAGKRADLPVWALLVDHPISWSVGAYATCFDVDPRISGAAVAAKVAAAGWPIQKWRPPESLDAASFIDTLAIAAGGDDRIAIDFGGRWPLSQLKEFLAQLRSRLAWIEEPLPPWLLHLAGELTLPAPHAAGEHCYGPHEAALLEAAHVNIWQPDAVFCGGFDNFIQIAARATTAKARCVPHGGGLLVALHAAACGADIAQVEWHLTLEARRQAHLADPVIPSDDLRVRLPQRPGWAGQLHTQLQGGAHE